MTDRPDGVDPEDLDPDVIEGEVIDEVLDDEYDAGELVDDDAITAEGSDEEPAEPEEAPVIEPPVRQPGLRTLRAAVAAMTPRRGSNLGREALAGLTVTIGSIPSAMANGLLAGVNPIYGLYGNMAGGAVGGAFAASRLMVINTTAVAALVAGQSLTSVPSEDRPQALFLMVILAGIIQLVLGALRAGRLIRFISFSVMTGFVAGIGVVLVLSQLPTMTGFTPDGGNEVTQTIDLAANLGDIDPATLALAVVALALVMLLPRTPLDKVASLLAIVVPTLLVLALGLESVRTVSDIGEIPAGIPLPAIPDLSLLSVDLVGGAFAVAIVSLVQSAGVSQSLPRKPGSGDGMSRDFLAQGVGNVAAGLVRGLPVGGSLSATALNVSAGAQRRAAGIFSGIWTLVLVAAFSWAVSAVAMPALGALLLYAALRSIQAGDVVAVWHAGWPATVGAATTFVCTLFLPIQVAVPVGMALSALLYVGESSTNVSVIELVQRSDGRIEERAPAQRLPGSAITVLHVYGNLFYAGARTLQSRLPEPGPEQRPVVVLRLRGHGGLGATAVDVLTEYARQLHAVDGQLFLSGLSPKARQHLLRSDEFSPTDRVRVYEATEVLGESTSRAYTVATGWLMRFEDPYVDELGRELPDRRGLDRTDDSG